MGEIADGLINGDFDSFTGEYLGKGPGYPRTRDKSLPWEYKGKTKGSDISVSSIQKLKNIVIATKVYKRWHEVAFDYRNVPADRRKVDDTKSLQRLAKGICNELPKFEEYCKSFNKKDEQKT